MILTIGGREVEGIHQAVGECSTMANLVMTSDTYRKNYGMLSGWIPDSGNGDTDITDVDYNAVYYWRKKIYNDKKKGTVISPLKTLFGFCDYTKILYLLKINLSLI
ncbi:MAG: hypothetical protein LH629_09230, partial [Ignavibacteria bacterium]|nr:hypothetical protein [Ignavibacteria bacterium]